MGKAMKAWASAALSGIIAFLTSLLTAFQGQETGFDTITTSQWLTAVLAFFVAFGSTWGVTYGVPNQPPTQRPARRAE
jgi:hypothetical protein